MRINGKRFGRLAAVVLVAGLVAGCAAVPGADDPIDVDAAGPPGLPHPTTPLPPATGPARPSPGCTPKGGIPDVSPFDGSKPIAIGPKPRSYLLHVPVGLAPAKPVPLVLDFHGLGTDANLQKNATDWDGLADKEGVILVHPQGENNIWQFGVDDANPDIPYVRALTKTVQAERCVDLSRTYATGLSMGSLLASAMSCKAPELFAAYGLVAGVQYKPPCDAAPARAFLVMWGNMDCTLPWYGGLGPCLAVGPPRTQPTAPLPPDQDMGFPPVDTVLEQWAKHLGCSDDPEVQLISPSVTRSRFQRCKPNAALDLYFIQGGSHTWPGSKLFMQLEQSLSPEERADRGTTTPELDATRVIWNFFKAHQLPPA